MNEIRAEIAGKRKDWNRVRTERLKLKASLEKAGCSNQKIRRHRDYRKLVKEQHFYSVRIVHLERKLFRMNRLAELVLHKK